MGILRTIAENIRIAAPPKERSSRWPTIRKAFLASHGACACCGGTKLLEVHHIVPFHVDSDLELNPDNLITLCESASDGIVCHLCVGHLGNYKNNNPEVVEDAARWLSKLSKKL
jgi:5-methylcytosine-specific restriction endonuclease McrA